MKAKEATILTGKPNKFVPYRSPEKEHSEGVGGTRHVLRGTVKYAVLDITGKTIINSLSNQNLLGRLELTIAYILRRRRKAWKWSRH